MNNPDPDTIVRRFLDGELSEEEVQDALHRIADDPQARSLLQFELRMTQNLAASRSPEPSPGFAARTAEQAARTDPSGASFSDRIRDWWRAVSRPLVTIPLRPAHTLGTLLLVAAAAWILWSPLPSPSPASGPASSQTTAAVEPTTASTNPETVWSRFVYTANDADSVAVAGDFSNWTPIPLSPHTVNGKTVWTGLVPVPRGEHEYQFVIDGEKWVTDPLAPVKQDDGFGAKNAVLKL